MHARRRLARSLVLTLIPLLLVACATGRKPGFPSQSVDDAVLITALEDKFKLVEKLSTYDYGSTDATARNEIISQRLVLMDLHYNRFVSDFASDKQTIDTITDVIVLGLSIAGTAVGGAGTKTVLAALSSGVTGSKLAVDKNFYYEKTVSALVAAMNAQRKAALVPILDGMNRPTTQYPLARALADLDNYYRAGTFLGALQAIQADAGAKERDADEQIKTLRLSPVTQSEVDDTLRLRRAIANLTDETKGKMVLTALRVDTSTLDTLGKVKEQLARQLQQATTRAQIDHMLREFNTAGIQL